MSDKIRAGDPDQSEKKPSAIEDDRPRNMRSRDDDDDDRRPRKAAQPEADDLGNSPLGAVVPLGVSVWALASLYLSLLSCVIPGLGLLAILCGVLAFLTHTQKATYGSISGNVRAIIGIGIGVLTTLGQITLLIMWYLSMR